MAIGGRNIIDEKGKKYWADKQSEGLPLDQEQELKLMAGRATMDEMVEMLEKNRFSARQLMWLGQAAGKLGNAWITEMAFTEALDIEPDNGQAYGDLITYYAAQGDWESCKHMWENGLILATQKYYLRYHYGRALYMQELFSEALVEAQAALTEVNFDDESCVLLALHSYLGKIANQQSNDVQTDFSEAKQVWQAALVRFPKSEDIQALSIIFSRDEFEG